MSMKPSSELSESPRPLPIIQQVLPRKAVSMLRGLRGLTKVK